MATATAQLQCFTESTNQRGVSLHVDRENNVVRGVKILGAKSVNGRRYTTEAMAKAAPLYEGANVNVNHPKGNPKAIRDLQDRNGLHRNIVAKADGLYSDWHFNPKHPLTESLLWAAENQPETFGFSHNADCRANRRGNETVVEEIAKVTSVDLVADPATTTSLYEHKEATVSKSLKEVIEGTEATTEGRDSLVTLIEMSAGMAEIPVDYADGAGAADQIKSGLRSAMVAVLDDDSMDTASKIKWIKKVLKVQEDDSTPPPKKEEAMPEAKQITDLQEEVKHLKAKDDVRALIESTKAQATEVQIKAATLLEGDERKAFVESLPKTIQTRTARSTSPTTMTESKNAPAAPQFKDNVSRAAYLRK